MYPILETLGKKTQNYPNFKCANCNLVPYLLEIHIDLVSTGNSMNLYILSKLVQLFNWVIKLIKSNKTQQTFY